MMFYSKATNGRRYTRVISPSERYTMAAEDNLSDQQFNVTFKTPGGSSITRTHSAPDAVSARRQAAFGLRAEGYSRQAHTWSTKVERAS